LGTSYPIDCPNGTYGDDILLKSADECKKCPAGKYCTKGKIQGDCEAGYICYHSNDRPDPQGDDIEKGDLCPIGHWCPKGTQLPIPCSNSTVGYTKGGKSPSVCEPCKAGYWCLDNQVVPQP